ncbi:MAG: dihydrofolate reductase family protein [Candidatus Dormiibacterota bacterium]
MAPASPGDLPSFELLEESADLPVYALPERLATAYAGTLGFGSPCLYANFVESVDGVVSFGPELPSAGGLISGDSPADRFLMGLLRACADTVLLGAGTLRGSPGHRWTPEHVFPAAAEEYAALRRFLGRRPIPRLALISAGGDFDVQHTGLLPGTVIFTGDAGAARLRGRLGPGVAVRSLGDDSSLSMHRVVEELRKDGDLAILSEGGPSVLGQLLRAGLVDDLFLTLAPTILGRSATEQRLGLVEATLFTPGAAPQLDLRSVRRHRSHLFLRYGIGLDGQASTRGSSITP